MRKKICMNSQMAIPYNRIKKYLNEEELNPALSRLAKNGFVRQSGCLLFADLIDRKTNATFDDFPDLTGYECFFNHIHFDDYLEDNEESLPQAIKFGFELSERLMKFSFPSRVIISYSGNDNCVVRFHKKREGEEWLDDNLENYVD